MIALYAQTLLVSVQCSEARSQRPAGVVQPLRIPSPRWSHANFEFITDIPLNGGGDDSSVVITVSLLKMAPFITTKETAPETPRTFRSAVSRSELTGLV